MANRIYRPDSIYVIRYGGLNPDPDAEPICSATTTKFNAMNALRDICDELNKRYPRMTWFLDVTDAKGKKNYLMESLVDRRIFVSVNKVPFTDCMPILPFINYTPTAEEIQQNRRRI